MSDIKQDHAIESKDDYNHIDRASAASPVASAAGYQAHYGGIEEKLAGKHDAALDILGGERIEMTDAQSRLVCRKIDKRILPILMWIYFLQILDKSTIGYGANFGMQTQAKLVGNQYSIIGSAGYWAQLAWQPFSAWLIVRVSTKWLMATVVFCWGCAMLGMAASTSYKPLLATRFLLGLFEASCLPLFSVVTAQWYRRNEQPLRIAMWYGTNGLASIFGSLLAFALSHITNGKLYVYQIIFLLVGLLTVLSAPIIVFRLDDNPATAKFLNDEEKKWAVERLRSNNTGVQSKEVKWPHVWETLYSPSTWLFISITFCINVGASVTNVFGPLIIGGIGFTPREAILLNMPFGFLQLTFILLSSWAATKYKVKSAFLMALMIPCVAGAATLYSLGRGKGLTGPLLTGYYLISPLFGANPLIVSWMVSNISGRTKQALSMSLYNCGNAAGNIVGPLLFKASEKPIYKHGLQAVMGIFVANIGCTAITVVWFFFLNKRKEAERVRNGKPAKLVDRSMDAKYVAASEEVTETGENGVKLGENAFLDMTDFKNDEFIYTY